MRSHNHHHDHLRHCHNQEPNRDISFKTPKHHRTNSRNYCYTPRDGGNVSDGTGPCFLEAPQSGSVSSYKNLVNCSNCSRCLTRPFCKLHSNHLYGSNCSNAMAHASTDADAVTAPNAEDNKYTMILSRSCRPLKFSFASEWLV